MSTSDARGQWDPWTYHRDAGVTGSRADLTGFDVEATDGGIGSIDQATYEVGASYLVVDTGPWIFGSKVMLPAGTVTRVDRSGRKVYVARSKAEIKDAPKFDKETYRDREYHNRLGDYYRKFRY